MYCCGWKKKTEKKRKNGEWRMGGRDSKLMELDEVGGNEWVNEKEKERGRGRRKIAPKWHRKSLVTKKCFSFPFFPPLSFSVASLLPHLSYFLSFGSWWKGREWRRMEKVENVVYIINKLKFIKLKPQEKKKKKYFLPTLQLPACVLFREEVKKLFFSSFNFQSISTTTTTLLFYCNNNTTRNEQKKSIYI